MSKLLKKYALTEAGQKVAKSGKFIHLPKNRLGDPDSRIDLTKISDAQAGELLLRRNGRGKQFVQPAPAEAAKSSSK